MNDMLIVTHPPLPPSLIACILSNTPYSAAKVDYDYRIDKIFIFVYKVDKILINDFPVDIYA